MVPFLLCANAIAGFETIEVAEIQHVKRAEGIVRDTSGAPVAGVKILLRESGSKKEVANVQSHLDGHFAVRHLPPGEYEMHVNAKGFDPMLYHLKIDPQGARSLLIVKMQVGT
jgi:hypothetical protein